MSSKKNALPEESIPSDSNSWTPLRMAVENDHKDVAEFLRQLGGHE
jgi:hypothetical protein